MDYILKYIDDNLSAHLTLSDVASYAGYSTWHFCEKFKNSTGMTFTEYLRNRRMQHAVNALLRGESFQDIAFNAGYETVSGFEKAFYKQYSCMPAEYRQRSDHYRALYQERRSQRLQLTDRCQILKDRVTAPVRKWNHAIGLYSYHFWKGFYQLKPEERTNYSTQAAGLSFIISRHRPVIQTGELIVGEIFPTEHIEQMERGIMDLIRTQPKHARSYLERGPLRREQIDELFAWASDPDCRWPYIPGESTLSISPRQLLQQNEGAAMGDCSVDTHSIPDYEKVLRLGFSGICKELETAATRENLTARQREFYSGCLKVCRACCEIGERYAEQAMLLAEQAENDSRREELLQIARICRQVPARPAQSFYEAVQSLFFAHMLNTLEDGVNANSLGRIDQLLYPYYRRDIDSGLLTRQEAFELMCCLWIKLYRNYDVQQCTLGGCDAEGKDAVNELSYLILDVTEELDLVRCLSVRYGSYTPRAFLLRAFEVLSHLNKGINAFYNDAVFIPALRRRGIEDAWDYGVIGCAEIAIPGKSNMHPVTARVNLLKALEYALTGGESILNPGTYPGLRRNKSNFRSFTSLKKAVYDQMDQLLDTAAQLTERMTQIRMQEWPQFYKSFLTEGCIQKGRSYCDHGAKYDFDEVMLLGLPNLADAMIAIKRLVYDRKKYTLEQIVDAMWQNHSDKALLEEIRTTVPKYGNGIKEVDLLAAELMEHACSYLEKLPGSCSDGYMAQMLSYLWSIDQGSQTPATPDGRRKGEALADGVSPVKECDYNGVAAVLQSVGTLPAQLSPGGFSATVDIDSVLFTDCHLELLLDLFLQASEKGLAGIQYNIQDSRQSNLPIEAERNIAVQVFGYRQQYDQLDRRIREFIKERTKHQLL